jgi:hypothetical protein
MVLKIVLWAVVIGVGLLYMTRRSQNRRHKAQR